MLKKIKIPIGLNHYDFIEVTSSLGKRIVENVELSDSGCWVWTKCLRSTYSAMRVNGRLMSVHRLSYSLFVGDITNGMTVDHICNNRQCVNPFHLQLLPLDENTFRGNSPPAKNKRKTRCKKGHLFVIGSYYNMSDNERLCKKCNADRRKRQRALKRHLKLTVESMGQTPYG